MTSTREHSEGLARFFERRGKIVQRAKAAQPAKPVCIPAAIVDAIGVQKAAALATGADMRRDWQALHNRSEVERMSLTGTPVAQIATALNLSKGHVVALRAQPGVGRRR